MQKKVHKFQQIILLL